MKNILLNLKQWNITIFEFSLIIEGATEKVYNFIHLLSNIKWDTLQVIVFFKRFKCFHNLIIVKSLTLLHLPSKFYLQILYLGYPFSPPPLKDKARHNGLRIYDIWHKSISFYQLNCSFCRALIGANKVQLWNDEIISIFVERKLEEIVILSYFL